MLYHGLRGLFVALPFFVSCASQKSQAAPSPAQAESTPESSGPETGTTCRPDDGSALCQSNPRSIGADCECSAYNGPMADPPGIPADPPPERISDGPRPGKIVN